MDPIIIRKIEQTLDLFLSWKLCLYEVCIMTLKSLKNHAQRALKNSP